MPGVDEHPALTQIVAEANAGSFSSLTLDPSNTRPGLRYRFGASLTDCVGVNSTASMDADRVAGAVPFVYPTSGRVEFATRYSASFTVAMETRIPDVNESVLQFGPSCDVDVTELTYIWTNLTGEADCFFTDVRSTAYAGFERAPRATRRSLVIPRSASSPERSRTSSSYSARSGARPGHLRVAHGGAPDGFPVAPGGGDGGRSGSARRREKPRSARSTRRRPSTRTPSRGRRAERSFVPVVLRRGGDWLRARPRGRLEGRHGDGAPVRQSAGNRRVPRGGERETGGGAGGPAVPDGVSSAMALDTLYRFTVQYQVGDSRVANVSTLVHAVDARVPSVYASGAGGEVGVQRRAAAGGRGGCTKA